MQRRRGRAAAYGEAGGRSRLNRRQRQSAPWSAVSTRDLAWLALTLALFAGLAFGMYAYVNSKEAVSAISTSKYKTGPKREKPRDAAVAAHAEADRLLREGDLHGALQWFEQTVVFANSAIDRFLEYSAHNNAGAVRLRLGNLANAEQSFRAAIKAVPEEERNVGARVNLGNALLQQGKAEAALGWLRRVVDEDPQHANAYFFMGSALTALRRHREAAAAYRQAVAVLPTHVGALHKLGASLTEEGGHEAEAIECFRKVLRLDPQMSSAMRNLANVMLTSSEADAAPHGDEDDWVAKASPAALLRRAQATELAVARRLGNAAVPACEQRLTMLTNWSAAEGVDLLPDALSVVRAGASHWSAPPLAVALLVGSHGETGRKYGPVSPLPPDSIASRAPLHRTRYSERIVTLASISDAYVAGTDPVVTQGHCNILGISHGSFVDVLEPRRAWLAAVAPVAAGLPEESSVRKLSRVVSILQPRAHGFYHFVMESLVRLAFMLPVLQDDVHGDLTLLVPGQPDARPFVRDFLELLGVQTSSSGRARQVVYAEEGTVYHARQLLTVDWRPTDDAEFTEFLPPAEGLRRLRAALLDGVDTPSVSQRKNVVFISRAESSTAQRRGLTNEAEIIDALHDALSADDLAGLDLNLVVYRGRKSELTETRDLFLNARAVVGVHGGALANTILCEKGTAVIEIGMAETHWFDFFSHAAAALDLEYWELAGAAPPSAFRTAFDVRADRVVGALRRAVLQEGSD